MDAHPFRFMDLPLEIRFMVYENLPRRIVHQRIYDNGKPQPSLLCVLVTRPVSLSLMRTCRVVYEESRGVIEAVLKNFILINPPTVILNFTSNAPVILAALSWYLLHELRLPQATPELRWEQHMYYIRFLCLCTFDTDQKPAPSSPPAYPIVYAPNQPSIIPSSPSLYLLRMGWKEP
jgi:hypothetical protein